jgi:glycosyltransferase involved in cell wall biosynthesis
MTLSLALVAEGNAETPDCWSGCAKGFVDALRRLGASVDVIDVAPRSWRRALAAGISVHPDRRRWRQRYTLGGASFAIKSAAAASALRERRRSGLRYDAIVQIGATFQVPEEARGDAVYAVYADANIRFALRGAPFSGASRLAPAEIEGAARRERHVYDAADRIWTMSRAVVESFVSDFGQPLEKLIPIHGGANNVPPAPDASAARGPVILFIGKDHERKGSAQLLEAFEIVRAQVPAAELHIVGGVPPGADRPGVTAHGFVSRHDPEGARKLAMLFRRAAVFCMPSQYEPFGVVFAEAMLGGMPCVATTEWAMPEIIVDGETGWLVPPGAPRQLASALLDALQNPGESARRGRRGRDRALALFTWDRVAERALADLDRYPARAAARTSSYCHAELPE